MMAVRDIVLYREHEAALRRKSQPVRAMNRRIQNLIQDLKDTLAHHPEGIGLSAPQINVHDRVIVVRLGGRSEVQRQLSPPVALINPEIVESGYEQKDFDGCLSLPGLYAETVRPHLLHVTGLDEWGRPFECIFGGLDAVVVHHEIDHLDGVLFIDRVERIEELYRVRLDQQGHLVRVPVSAMGA
jgi:peptide deformylase